MNIRRLERSLLLRIRKRMQKGDEDAMLRALECGFHLLSKGDIKELLRSRYFVSSNILLPLEELISPYVPEDILNSLPENILFKLAECKVLCRKLTEENIRRIMRSRELSEWSCLCFTTAETAEATVDEYQKRHTPDQLSVVQKLKSHRQEMLTEAWTRYRSLLEGGSPTFNDLSCISYIATSQRLRNILSGRDIIPPNYGRAAQYNDLVKISRNNIFSIVDPDMAIYIFDRFMACFPQDYALIAEVLIENKVVAHHRFYAHVLAKVANEARFNRIHERSESSFSILCDQMDKFLKFGCLRAKLPADLRARLTIEYDLNPSFYLEPDDLESMDRCRMLDFLEGLM